MAMDITWAINELETFADRCERHRGSNGGLPEKAILYREILGQVPIVEQIADRTWSEWRNYRTKKYSDSFYSPLDRIVTQLLVLLRRKKELEEKLGESGPSLSAATMHPDVWEASKSLWRNGHFGEAVSAAAKSVNAALQTKVGRRDASDTQLVSESFSLSAPKPGVPRLRLMADDGSETYKSLHEGALAFGRGCFMGIRNVLAHEYGPPAEPPEELALHYLAAFSVLARWIDDAKVEK